MVGDRVRFQLGDLGARIGEMLLDQCAVCDGSLEFILQPLDVLVLGADAQIFESHAPAAESTSRWRTVAADPAWGESDAAGVRKTDAEFETCNMGTGVP
jgi:hypothetical protein